MYQRELVSPTQFSLDVPSSASSHVKALTTAAAHYSRRQGWEGLAAPCMGRMHHMVHASFDHGKPMCAKCFKSMRDRSLITGRGEGGGALKVYLYKKGGTKKV